MTRGLTRWEQTIRLSSEKWTLFPLFLWQSGERSTEFANKYSYGELIEGGAVLVRPRLCPGL